MRKIENLSQVEIQKIGERISRSFMAEDGLFQKIFNAEESLAFFRALTQVACEAGCLYTTTKRQEGFAIYWKKSGRPGLRSRIRLNRLLAQNLSWKTRLRLNQALKSWDGCEDACRSETDYIRVFLAVVLSPYQGQGFLHELLEDALQLAQTEGIPCILNTDSQLKMQKYEACGMKLVKETSVGDEVTLYTMEYRG